VVSIEVASTGKTNVLLMEIIVSDVFRAVKLPSMIWIRLVFYYAYEKMKRITHTSPV
jgi:hypothetical protein